MPNISRLIFPLFTTLWGAPLAAHEFWILPEDFVIQDDAQVEASLRVGEKLVGIGYPFNPKRFERFEVMQNGETYPVEGRLGDSPALNMEAPGEGLLVVVHETNDSTLKYSDWAKFVKFATHKDFATTLSDHAARGLPEQSFTELYRRYGKALIAVGDGAGSDLEVGMKTEIVAFANPYTEARNTFPVRVLLDGAPRADVQVELFEKNAQGGVEVTLHRTDQDGVADLPVKRGHSYLADAVTMLPMDNDDPEAGPVWWSLWASLTFAVPQAPLE